MVCNLRAIGLALAAVFVFGAVTASTASAVVVTSDGPVTLLGTQTGEASANALTAFGGETRCPNATYTGHKVNNTPHGLISSGAEQITITPHYGSCTALGFPATIDMNGCDYQYNFTVGAIVEMVINCPAEKNITITIFGSATKHMAHEPFCHITITEWENQYSGLLSSSTFNGTIDITGEIAGQIEAHKKSPTGSILCPTEATSTATLKQDVTFSGRNAEGKSTEVSRSF